MSDRAEILEAIDKLNEMVVTLANSLGPAVSQSNVAYLTKLAREVGTLTHQARGHRD